jgi:hypothetical protein
MEEFPIADSEFVISGPVWVLANSSQVSRGVMGVVEFRWGGTAFLTAFTDRDLAERFLERHPYPGFKPTNFATPEAFFIFLRQAAAEAGYTHVGFDPRADVGKPLRLIPVAELLKKAP